MGQFLAQRTTEFSHQLHADGAEMLTLFFDCLQLFDGDVFQRYEFQEVFDPRAKGMDVMLQPSETNPENNCEDDGAGQTSQRHDELCRSRGQKVVEACLQSGRISTFHVHHAERSYESEEGEKQANGHEKARHDAPEPSTVFKVFKVQEGRWADRIPKVSRIALTMQNERLAIFGPSRNHGGVGLVLALFFDSCVDVCDGGGKRLGRFMAVYDVPQPFQRLDLAVNLPPVEQACEQEPRKETQGNETRCIFFNQKASNQEDKLSRRVTKANEVRPHSYFFPIPSSQSANIL